MSDSPPHSSRRDPSAAHTLAGVLTRLQAGEDPGSPGLAQRLDRAFAKHTRALHWECRRQLPGFPPERVEEIAQDVLVEAWVKLPSYRPEASFRAFLWGIASMKCANARRKRQDALTADGFCEDLPAELVSALDRMANEQRDELVRAAAARVLDPGEQDLIELRWVQDYPLDHIAAELQLPGSNEVRVALQRCKRRMHAELHRALAERGLGVSFLGGVSR